MIRISRKSGRNPARNGLLVRSAVGAALALAIAGTAALPAPAVAKEKAPKAEANSPDFIKAAQPLQKTLAATQPLIKKYQTAADAASREAAMAELKAAMAPATPQLAAAQAVATTAQDKYIVGQWGSTVGTVLGDTTVIQQSMQFIVDSGRAPAADADSYRFKLGISAYQNKDYPTAITALTPLVAANYPEDAAAEALALSYNAQKQPEQALGALKTAADARQAAGGAVPPQWLLRANQMAYRLKNPVIGTQWAILTVGYAPTTANWLSSAQLLRVYNGYTGQEALDLSRLLKRTGALTGNSKEVRQEVLEYIQTADARRQPGEVLSVIEAGLREGAIGEADLRKGPTDATDPPVLVARTIATQRLAADKAALPALYRDAAAPATTAALALGTGDAFLGHGDAAKAAEVYKLALAKPGVDAGRALTRLGIAQIDTGDYAGALDSFGKVTGPRQPLAQFWAAYARHKVSGK